MPSLNWIGKEAVVSHAAQVPTRLLHCDKEQSVGPDDCANLLVEGDNLAALKALLPFYAGSVKCVYIDPPYNTGNEGWIYNDAVRAPEIARWLGETVGKEAEDLSRHDKWLCMMYPRLSLLKEMLRDDGAIFISIDDNEVAHLRCLMDEIFGARNFVANIVWQKKQSPQNDAINFSDMHDHIVVYAKNAKQSRDDTRGFQRNLLPAQDTRAARYTNPDNDKRGAWTSVDYTCNKSADERPNLFYAIKNPNTNKDIWPSRNRVWGYDKSAHSQHLENKSLYWGANGKGRPRLKLFLEHMESGVVPSTWWTREQCGDNQEARRELRSLFSEAEQDFSTPKPTRLIKRILQLATDKDSLVLDSFSGSGTTAHAVMQLNAEDGGTRRFIGVEMEPQIARPVTRERLKRVIEGYGEGDKSVAGLGDGFRFCTLGEPLFAPDGSLRSDANFWDVAHFLFFSETGRPLPQKLAPRGPFLGACENIGYFLWLDGAIDAARVLAAQKHDGPRVLWAPSCRVSRAKLEREGVLFKQLPYEVKTR